MDTKLLKQKILDLAIRGKLVPQDPNDEPASILLEKIKKEKEKLIKEGKIKKDKKESTIFLGDDKLHYEKLADGTVKNIEEEIPFNIPESWYWCRLNNLASYKKGPFGSAITKSIFVPQNNNTYKVYEQGNAINKTVDYGKYYISQEKFHELQSFEIHENDIIVSCAGTIGETFIIPIVHPKGIINQALMKISLFNNNISTFYLLYFDRIIKNKSNADSNGSAIKNIPPFDVLKQYLIPIPPLQEQQRIVSKIEELFKQVDAIEEEKQSLLKLIDKAKNKVLDLAMTGKLVKQDPNDEPASRLLEKIFEEKKKLAKEGKIKLSKDELLSPPTSVDNDYYQKMGYDRDINWCQCDIRDVLYYEQPTVYIVKNTRYNDNFKTPVLTAGKSFILGYTDEIDGIYDKVPCIIFDDFTTDTKYVDFNFKVKSSAMKILKNITYTNIKYLYYFIKQIEIVNNTHKRYWISDFSKRKVILPSRLYQDKVVQVVNDYLNSLNQIKEELN